MKDSQRYGLSVTDCVFMCSRDGRNFRRYDEAFMTPGPENGRNWVYGDCYPSRGIIETPSDAAGADPELSMYSFENHFMGIPANLIRYTVRRDGFVSLHAGAAEETVLTKPFIYGGGELYANLSTSAWGYMYFTLISEDGGEFQSCEYFGDSTDKRIAFSDDAVAKLSGKPVRLRVRLRDSDLYSLRFS